MLNIFLCKKRFGALRCKNIFLLVKYDANHSKMQYNCGKATMFDENFFEKAGNAIRTRDILVGNEMLYH